MGEQHPEDGWPVVAFRPSAWSKRAACVPPAWPRSKPPDPPAAGPPEPGCNPHLPCGVSEGEPGHGPGETGHRIAGGGM